MKKSFSILLSAAVAFGSFASLTSAAEMTAQEKFEALKAKGIFTGINAAGDAGLDQNMNRAQFARVAALILGLEGIGKMDTLKVTEKPFPDVDLGKWYTEEVAAVKAAKVLVGNADGTFNPEGNISVQELAVVTANLLSLKPVEDAKVEGAADWAAKYIKAIQDAGVSFPTNYTEAATRGQLVAISFQADEKLNPVAPAKVSVASAKAVDVNMVEVALDKAVDTAKATLTLKRGTATVATTTKWSDDKKSATLTLTSTKIAEDDYTVTLAGLTAEEIGTAAGSFKGANETVTKLEFVTASDEIAQSDFARVKLRAENQYGKQASFSAASYTVSTDAALGAVVAKDSAGDLVINLDTNNGSLTPGLSMIPIYVYFNETHLTASKTFKLGFAPFVTKLELGDVKYNNGKDALVNNGDNLMADVKLYDQYGNPLTVPQVASSAFNSNIAPYNVSLNPNVSFADYDNDNEYEARVILSAKADKGQDYTLNVYAGSATASKTFKVSPARVPVKVDIEPYGATLATGDSGKYVTLLAYDANGEQLTAQEIADNASAINVSATGVTGIGSPATVKIVTVGPNKGKIALGSVTAPAKSYVFVTASVLTPNANSFKTYQIPVAEARVPASLALDTKNKAKAVLGASSDFKIKVKDQYGDDIGGTTAPTGYRVVADFITGTSGISVTGLPTTYTADTTASVITNFDDINNGSTFATTDGAFGTASLKLTLQKQNASSVWIDASMPVTVSIESINPAIVALNYSLSDITSLYAATDSKLLPVGGTTPTTSKLAKTVGLVVKDNAGVEVAYPDNVKEISTSNPLVAEVAGNTTKGFVLGNKAGEATVTAVVYKANGETASLTAKVTVKADTVAAASVSANGDKEVLAGSVVGSFLYSSAFMDLKVKDQYDIELSGTDINTYDKFTGIRYTISEVKGATISINAQTGEVTAFTDTGADGIYQFVVTATAPNGKSASTLVFHN